jgi:hypothetical protein
VNDAWTIVRAASDDERSTNEPDARWRRCKELRTSQCVVSHIAPFSLPLGVCHVVTCLCFVAFVGMLLSSFLFASFFVYCIVCVYICMFISIIMCIFVRRTCVGPSCLARVREPSARDAQTVKLASRVSRRGFEQSIQRTVIERSSCARCIFSFPRLRSTFTFIAVII